MLRTVLFAPGGSGAGPRRPVRAAQVPRRGADDAGAPAGRHPRRLRPGAQAAQRAAEVRPARARRSGGDLGHARRLGRAPRDRRRRAGARPLGAGRRAAPARRRRLRRPRGRQRRAGRLAYRSSVPLPDGRRVCRTRCRSRPLLRAAMRRTSCGRLRSGASWTAASRWSARTATSWSCSLGGGPRPGFASHGESWSLALALRFGAFALLRSDGVDPVLVLDDVFAELDTARRDRLADPGRGRGPGADHRGRGRPTCRRSWAARACPSPTAR